MDYSVAQFESQRLEIACLTREVEELREEVDHLQKIVRLIGELIEAPTVKHLPNIVNEATGLKNSFAIITGLVNAAKAGGDDE